MDSDLAESLSALKSSFESRKLSPSFGKADPALVRNLHQKLRIPRRFRDFLTERDPLHVEIVTPAERIQLIAAAELEAAQVGFALSESGAVITTPTPSGWRPSWVIVAQSTILGDPYFLDTSKPNAEGALLELLRDDLNRPSADAASRMPQRIK